MHVCHHQFLSHGIVAPIHKVGWVLHFHLCLLDLMVLDYTALSQWLVALVYDSSCELYLKACGFLVSLLPETLAWRAHDKAFESAIILIEMPIYENVRETSRYRGFFVKDCQF